MHDDGRSAPLDLAQVSSERKDEGPARFAMLQENILGKKARATLSALIEYIIDALRLKLRFADLPTRVCHPQIHSQLQIIKIVHQCDYVGGDTKWGDP